MRLNLNTKEGILMPFPSLARASLAVPLLGLVTIAPAQWTDTTLGEGVVHRRQVYSNLYGGTQTVNMIQVDLNNPNVQVQPVQPSSGCSRTSVLGSNAKALAAINGGFFDGSCASLSMIKINGTVSATNPGYKPARATIGLKKNAASVTPSIARIASTDPWAGVDHALGGGPNLVTNGALDVSWSAEGFDSSYTSKNPRTAVGITASNQLLMVTVDGRTAAGVGMTLNELGQYMLNLGCVNAMNLDGGGSTTCWTAQGGVRNTPSDGSERAVASALAVWSDGFIVDNGQAGYSETGTWASSANAGFYGTNSRWNQGGGTGADTATWVPNLPLGGRYEVYGWWVAGSNRATNAPYRIDHIGGSNTIPANQTLNGGKWNLLGEFSFNAGTTGKVVLNDLVAADRVVSADAVRFVYKGPAEIVQDNVAPNFIHSSNWQASTGAPGYLGANFHVRPTAAVSDPVTWRATLPTTGNYRVYARWTSASNRATSAPYVVVHTGGSTTVYVNQQQNGGTWVLLGTFNMVSGTLDRVRLSCWTTAGFYVSADAVKFEPVQ
jgi:hypothetical protein